MSTWHRVLAALSLALTASAAFAATYLPLSDAELYRRSPLVIRGTVLDQSVRVEKLDGRDHPFTITRFAVLEELKGAASGDTLSVRLPGGRIGDLAWWLPGTPVFAANQEVVLFLRPGSGQPGEYRLSEFGLSHFDVVQDGSGRRFVTRPAFGPEEDLALALRASILSERRGGGAAVPLRDAESFLAALREAARTGTLPEILCSTPAGSIVRPGVFRLTPEWVNIGGPEPGNCMGTPCLFRWFWDTGASPNAVVSVNGTQSNLSDGSNGVPRAQNGVTQWHGGVPATDIRVSGITPGGNVTVNLDAVSSHDGGSAWSTPLACGTGGTIGLGGPGPSSGPRTFKGDSSYYAPNTGTVSMRQRTGSAGCYSASVFGTAVMHEEGHVLGLGHPDQSTSTHSTTSATDKANAVMTSTVPASTPQTPQTDDIQAMQYYYGTGTAASCTPDATTLCLNGGRFKVTVAWDSTTQSGQGQAVPLTTDTGYFWFFNQANVEMVIKVLNACTLNSRYWVFAGGLTNVHVVITVTDTQNGTVVTKVNPQTTAFLPIQDTSAFATCP